MKKPIRKRITIRLSTHVYDALVEHAAKLDKRHTAVVTEALRKYLKLGEEK
jgi:hypothetical protein